MINFNSIHIKTERLNLRPISRQDLHAAYAIFSDDESMQYWSDPPLQKISQAKEKIMRNIAANEDGSALSLAVDLQDCQQMIGQISLFNIHQASARAEVGYVLSRTHWQQGLMNEAMQAFIAFCFNDLNLRRLEADIDPANEPSAGLLKKLGFVKEGLLIQRWKVGGVITDSEVYGLLNPKDQKF